MSRKADHYLFFLRLCSLYEIVLGICGAHADSLCSSGVRFASNPGSHAHETESFEQFNARYAGFFQSCTDLFELQRGLNNCFAYDLVPTVEVIEAALKCARKVNDYATAVRILEGLSVKVENKGQYQQYLDELKPLLEELGECEEAADFERAASTATILPDSSYLRV